MILQQEGALPALSQALGQVSPLQTLQLLIDQGYQETIKEAINVLSEQEEVSDAASEAANDLEVNTEDDVLLTHPVEQQAPPQEELVSSFLNSEEMPPLTREHLHSLDQLSLPVELDTEVAEYLITNRVNQLWEVYSHRDWSTVEALLDGDGGPFFTAIKKRFLQEVRAVEELTLPEGWSFRDRDGRPALPNLMQRRTAWAIREKRRMGNWSGTGAGKTLAALLAAHVIAARVTLIVTNAAAVEGWCKHIRSTSPESLIITTSDKLSLCVQAQSC